MFLAPIIIISNHNIRHYTTTGAWSKSLIYLSREEGGQFPIANDPSEFACIRKQTKLNTSRKLPISRYYSGFISGFSLSVLVPGLENFEFLG